MLEPVEYRETVPPGKRKGRWFICPSCEEKFHPAHILHEEAKGSGWQNPRLPALCDKCGCYLMFEDDYKALASMICRIIRQLVPSSR